MIFEFKKHKVLQEQKSNNMQTSYYYVWASF